MKQIVVCPECGKEFEVEVATKAGSRKGQLSGIDIKDMTLEQLSREIINAGSVLSKAKKRNASADVIEAAEARLAAAKAERDIKKAAAKTEEGTEVPVPVEVNETAEETYQPDEEL